MLLLYMGFYGLLHCAEKGKNGFESGPVRHLSNAKIFLSSPKKIQMSENPRVRQIAKAIWTFGCAERPEGERKAPRLLESLIVESNLDVRLCRTPRRGEKSP